MRQAPKYHQVPGEIKRSSRYTPVDNDYGPAIDSAERTSHDFTEWERIGRGGFGKVYRARPRKAQYGAEYVAIKVVDKRGLRDATAEQRLATEVAIHETLEHRHVVRLYESFEDGRFVYLVMEYCAGGDLWRHLRRRQQGMGGAATGEVAAVDENEARKIVGQVAAAMAYLHAGGVLHRDLKLANILLADSGDVRVADFGLATSVGAGLEEPATVCGTPSYLAPEMLARRAYGFEADVWALGCLLVTLLTGLQPFRSLRRITDDAVARVRLPSALSHDARDLIRVLLRVDPHARIRSEDILAHPFFSPTPPTRD
ncbi:kinase-like protein, partial [Coemansia reversa NRRL 1564]